MFFEYNFLREGDSLIKMREGKIESVCVYKDKVFLIIMSFGVNWYCKILWLFVLYVCNLILKKFLECKVMYVFWKYYNFKWKVIEIIWYKNMLILVEN